MNTADTNATDIAYITGNATPGQGDVVALAIVDKQRHAVSKLAADLSVDEDAALKRWLESDAPKFMHEAKAAYHMLRGRGIKLRGIAHDTAIAAYLLRPGQRTYALEDIYQRHLQRQRAAERTLEDAIADQVFALRWGAVVVMTVAGQLAGHTRIEGHVEQWRAVLVMTEILLANEAGTGEVALVAEDAVQLQRVADGLVDGQPQVRRVHDEVVGPGLYGRRPELLGEQIGDLGQGDAQRAQRKADQQDPCRGSEHGRPGGRHGAGPLPLAAPSGCLHAGQSNTSEAPMGAGRGRGRVR